MSQEPTEAAAVKAGSHSVDQPVRLCIAERDVPYTVGGNVVWERKPCGGQAMGGSRFCIWHHRDDYLKPEDLIPSDRDHRWTPESEATTTQEGNK